MVSEGYYANEKRYKLNQGYGAKTPIIDASFMRFYMKERCSIAFKKLTDKLD
jgi:glycerol-3-phosphate dehydrogenase (NAD(P)+)